MDLSIKTLKLTIRTLLLLVIIIIPFLKTSSLYFPYVSGKVYAFRFLVLLAFFFWVWLLLKEKRYKHYFKNILIISVVLFFLAQIFVSFFGVDPSFSFFSSFERGEGVLQYGFWVFYFLMMISVFRTKEDWKLFFSSFLIAAFLLSAYSWSNYDPERRFYGVFGNPAYFATFLLFAIGFSLLVFERKFFKSSFVKWLLPFMAGFFLLTLIFTKTRGAYAGFGGGLLLFCILSFLFLRKENKKLAFSGLAVFLAGIVSVASLFLIRETDFVQNRPILNRITEITRVQEVTSVSDRVLNWNIALKAFKERPVFGYGPENYGAAFNKYYDYRIGAGESWFDRAHSQPFEILATGGIVLFSFYLFWILSIFYVIFRISRKEKVLSFLLFSIFSAYLLQGFFLFDGLPTYLGLFPFLAFLVFQHTYPLEKSPKKEKEANLYLLIPAGLLSLFLIYATCFVPYKANALGLKFHNYIMADFYKKAKPFLEESFEIESPYTFWETRKMASWRFMMTLEEINKNTNPQKVEEMRKIYDFLTPELEKFIEKRPYYPQMYYVLPKIYRLGFEKLGKDDLKRAEEIVRKGFNYSDLRIEYFREFSRILYLQGRSEEAEEIIKSHIERSAFDEGFSHISLARLYFITKKPEKAVEHYEKAQEEGHIIHEDKKEYARYMQMLEETEEWQKIVDTALKYLEKWGPDSDTYFNIAVGYFRLGEKEKAREFFQKAVERNPDYQEYELFFRD